jgi:hypothetical protein
MREEPTKEVGLLLCEAGIEEALDVIGDLGGLEAKRDNMRGDIFLIDQRAVAPLTQRASSNIDHLGCLADGHLVALVGFFKNNSHV